MRRIGSPAEGLGVDAVGRGAGRGEGLSHEAGPRLRPADIDVTLSDVGAAGPQRGEVVAAADPGAEPRVGGPPGAGERDQADAALAGEDGELAGEQRLVGEAVE